MGASIGLAALLVALAILALPLGRRWCGDYFPPGTLVFSTWAVTLGLYFLRVIPYPDIAVSTLWLIGSCLALFIAGSIGGQAAGQRALAAPAPAPSPNAWVASVAVLSLLGLAWYAWAVSDVLGITAFVDRPWRIRFGLSDRSIRSTYLVLEFLCIATPILAAAFALTGHRLRPATWALVVVSTLGTWVSTDRTQFFVVLLTLYFMVVFAAGVRLSFIRLCALTAAVLLALGSYFLLVGVWQGKTPANLNVEIQVPTLTVQARPPQPARESAAVDARAAAPPAAQRWLTSVQTGLQRTSTIYLYATASYAALDVLLANPQPRTMGRQAIYPVGRLLERLGLVSGMPPGIPPFVPLGITRGPEITFNAYTFLYYPISDFGAAGALVYAGLIGLLAGFVYGRYSRNRRSAFWLMTIGHVSAALVLTVFVNKFNNTASWYIYLWCCLPFAVTRLASFVADRRRRLAQSGQSS